MRSILIILYLTLPVLVFSQHNKLDNLCDSFCEYFKVDSIKALSQKKFRNYYDKLKQNKNDIWKASYNEIDSLYNISEYQFEEFFRHQLAQSCEAFREVENEIFFSNPEQKYQQERFHLVQKLIYSIEDGDLDSTILR